MERELRLPGEGDQAFRARAERATCYARLLVDAALANHDIQELISSHDFPTYTEEGERRCPTVRVEYEQAMAIGGIGECLAATKNKSWGDGPYIHPLKPDDPVLPVRITYVFKEGSVYNRRFLQRRRMKELLGKPYRSLVNRAKGFTQRVFLEQLTAKEAYVIRATLRMSPIEFWRAATGSTFCELPEQPSRIDPEGLAAVGEKPKQLMLPLGGPKTREDFLRERSDGD